MKIKSKYIYTKILSTIIKNTLLNVKSVRFLATILTSNPSPLWGFSTAGIGAAGREGGSANTPACQPQDLPRNLGKQTVHLQSTYEDTATPKE